MRYSSGDVVQLNWEKIDSYGEDFPVALYDWAYSRNKNEKYIIKDINIENQLEDTQYQIQDSRGILAPGLFYDCEFIKEISEWDS